TRYREALDVSETLIEVAQKYRLAFAIPYALFPAAIAYAGLREWLRAERCLNEAERIVTANKNVHGQQTSYSIRLRTLVQQGRHEAALAVLVPDLRSNLPWSHGEVLTSRALLLASAGRLEEATSMVDG